MILLVAFLGLAALLQQTTGQSPDFAALSTKKAAQRNMIVNKHNALRGEVKPTARNMLKMEWNDAAAKNAQKQANQCTFTHTPEALRKWGENIYISGGVKSWSDAIQKWYNEAKNFMYGVGPKVPGAITGHYTQVVWATSKQIGCAVAYCAQKKQYFYVCHYHPAGNNKATINTPYKSGKPCGDCPKTCEKRLCTTHKSAALYFN